MVISLLEVLALSLLLGATKLLIGNAECCLTPFFVVVSYVNKGVGHVMYAV